MLLKLGQLQRSFKSVEAIAAHGERNPTLLDWFLGRTRADRVAAAKARIANIHQPNFFERLAGETEASIQRRGEINADYLERKLDLKEDMSLKRVALKEQAQIDALELENKVKNEKLETKLRQKYGLEKKPMGMAKKAVLGGGAIAGGVLGYNALTGGRNDNGGIMAQAEAEGSRAAIRDAMAGQGYGMPMPRIDAANTNHQGRLDEMALSRA